VRQSNDFYAKLDKSLRIIGRGRVVDVAIVRGMHQISLLSGSKFIIVATESAQKLAAFAVRSIISR